MLYRNKTKGIRPRHERGYSLIEVLMTCLIIQIIAGMVGVSVSSVTSTERTNYAAQEVITAIRYARQLAQTTGIPCGVTFDNTNQQVQVFRYTSATDSTPIIATDSAMPGGQYIIKLSQQADTSGVKISAISLFGGTANKTVTYGNIGTTSGLPKGLGSTANIGSVTMSLGSASKTISIPAAGEPVVH